MADKKKFLESKLGKVIIGIVSVVIIGGAASTMVACQGKEIDQTDIPTQNMTVDSGIVSPTTNPSTNPSTEQKVEEQQEQQQEQQEQNQGEEQQEENQGSGEEQGSQGGEEQGNQGGEQQEVDHEAEYKQMFLENLPKAIEDYYNENVAQIKLQKISSTELVDINLKTNKVYFTATQQNKNKIFTATSDIFANSTFEEMYGALENFSGDFEVGQKIVNQELADEIGAFALDQQEVKDFLSENTITYSDYKVISASEFYVLDGGKTATDININFGNKVLNLSISGSTGYKSTQEEYLDAFKNSGRTVSVVFNSVEEYQGMKNEIDAAFTEELIAELTSDAYINEHFENTGTGMAMKNFELAGRTNVPTFEFNY